MVHLARLCPQWHLDWFGCFARLTGMPNTHTKTTERETPTDVRRL